MTTTSTTGIRAKRIHHGAYRATINYQGQDLTCPHRHRTVQAARQCVDLHLQVRTIRQEKNQ